MTEILSPSDLETVVAGIVDRLADAEGKPDALLWVGGATWPVRTQVARAVAEATDKGYLSLSLPLSRSLQPIPPQRRPLKVQALVENLLQDEAAPSGWVLDHLELLFLPELRISPVQLLRHLAKTRTILAIWPGKYHQGRLIYAEPGHPEYLRERIPPFSYLQIDDLL